MDPLVEFCRSGRLGPLSLGAPAAEVLALLGRADDVRWVHDEPGWQLHRYGSMSLLFLAHGDGADPADPERLRLESITVELGPRVALPPLVAAGPAEGWAAPREADLRDRLRAAGVQPGALVEIATRDGEVTAIRAEVAGARRPELSPG